MDFITGFFKMPSTLEESRSFKQAVIGELISKLLSTLSILLVGRVTVLLINLFRLSFRIYFFSILGIISYILK